MIAIRFSGIFSGEQFSWFSSEEEKALWKRSISHVADSYNRNNLVVILNTARARLSMTEEAIADTHRWYQGKENPNGTFHWQGHGDYMSEQAAVGALINEFLLQSVEGIIRIFPAWPEDKDASFNNLRAQGGFLVTAEQREGKVTRLEVTSTADGILRLLSPWPVFTVDQGNRQTNLNANARGIVEIDTEAGQTFVFTGK